MFEIVVHKVRGKRPVYKKGNKARHSNRQIEKCRNIPFSHYVEG